MYKYSKNGPEKPVFQPLQQDFLINTIWTNTDIRCNRSKMVLKLTIYEQVFYKFIKINLYFTKCII